MVDVLAVFYRLFSQVDKKNAAVEGRAAPVSAAAPQVKPEEGGNVTAVELEQRRQLAEAAAASAGHRIVGGGHAPPPAGVKMEDDQDKLWWYLALGEENVLHN